MVGHLQVLLFLGRVVQPVALPLEEHFLVLLGSHRHSVLFLFVAVLLVFHLHFVHSLLQASLPEGPVLVQGQNLLQLGLFVDQPDLDLVPLHLSFLF